MQKVILSLFAVGGLFMTVACTSLDKQATLTNYRMTQKTTTENDVFYDASTLPQSVKDAAHTRNKEHRDLATAMALAAGNKPEDLNTATPAAGKKGK